jgi:hypothetical protein
MGMSVVPVSGQQQAAGVLARMVHVESKVDTNPLKSTPNPPNMDDAVLNTLLTVPR